MTQARSLWNIHLAARQLAPKLQHAQAPLLTSPNLHRALETLQQNRDNALRAGLQASNPPPSTTLCACYLNCTRQAASNYRRIKRDQHVQFKLQDHAGE